MFASRTSSAARFGDNLLGDAGANRMFGGGGGDTIGGGDGINYLRGDDGSDSLLGGAAFDDINGNMGDDTVSTGAGRGLQRRREGQRQPLPAARTTTWSMATSGTTPATATTATTSSAAGQDNDIVSGGNGDDFVSGDKGDDTMTGGAGADVFHTFGDAGLDRVTDFSLAQGDRVQLDPGTQFTVSQAGGRHSDHDEWRRQMILVGVP
jgi:serralysin